MEYFFSLLEVVLNVLFNHHILCFFSLQETLLKQENEEEDEKDERGQEETSPASLNQLTHSSALEQEVNKQTLLPALQEWCVYPVRYKT